MMNITWELVDAATSKFFYDAKDEDGNEERRMGIIRKNVIVVTLVYGNGNTEKIGSSKTTAMAQS